MHFFDQSIQELLNLKPIVISHLKRLNIVTLRDLLFHIPVYYVRKKIEPNYQELAADDAIVTTITIQSLPGFQDKIKKFSGINNFNQVIELIFFSQVPKFMWAYFKKGKTLTVQGKVSLINSGPQIAHPDIVFNQSLIKHIEPIYSLTGGVSNAQIHRYISYCLNLLPNIASWHTLEEELNMPSIRDSLINLHDPTDLESTALYMKRMALEEMLINQFLLGNVRKKNKTPRPYVYVEDDFYRNKIFENIGFVPTQDQLTVLEEIYQDQLSGVRMTRMLQGDVGCGKTFVALLSMLNVIKSGKQIALMAPTEILSQQHCAFFAKALEGSGITISLLTGSIKGKSREEILQDLQSGKIDILIGTHALFQEKIIFKNLGYVIIDEQHRFGVQQRLDLLSKAQSADLLLMSATPIPRSLNLVLYGDMDVSYLKAKPKNNQPIITSIMSDAKIGELALSLKNILDKGQKIYWICPLIEESEHKSYSNVILRHQTLGNIYGSRASMMHGGMTQAEKDQVMSDFKNGHVDIMVATTVIEVGIDVPNATLIVIEDASSFGLSQLHQLRGRVGRSNLQSYCILVYQAKGLSEVGKKRLNIIKSSNDGFEIAQQDLVLRGAGDFIGSRQSGQSSFIFTNFVSDVEFLELAKTYVEDNPHIAPSQDIVKLFDKEHIAQKWIFA